MSREPRKLGDVFENRREPGLAHLPIMSVTIDRGLVERRQLLRKANSALKPTEHLLARRGDLIYNMMRMWQGAVGLAPFDCIVSPAYVVLKPTDEIEPDFAFHLFKSPRMLYLLGAYSYGLTSDRLRLYYREFVKIPAHIPSLRDQRRVSRTLKVWDTALSTLNSLIDAKRLQGDAVTREVLAPSHDRKPRLALRDVASFWSGGTPEKSRFEYWDGDIPFLTARDLKPFRVSETARTLTAGGAAKSKIAPSGSVAVLIRGMTLLRDIPVGIVTRPMAFNQDVKVLVPNSSVDSEYLAHWLVASKMQLKRLVDRSGHGTGKLDSGILQQWPIVLPSLADQRHTVRYLSARGRELSLLQRKRDLLQEQKRGLVQQLFDDQT